MKRKLLLVPFLLTLLIISSCDNAEYTKVTAPEARAAYTAQTLSLTSFYNININENSGTTGLDITMSSDGKTITGKLDNFLVSSDYYSSISGEMIITINDDNSFEIVVDLSFTGSGPVYTMHSEMSFAINGITPTFTIFTVNGHDMKDDLLF
ncbi:MAG: hypothetical protein GY760_12260 [Deltaproteobacteria bacterium]|nr:hypothetical protein [Deltaproteobacteria bacterium]